MLNFTDALKRGIHPERPGVNQTQGLYGLKGMRPSNEGLIPFRELTQIAGSDIWPLCSAHRLIGEDVLYHENGVSNTTGLIGYEGNRYGIPHIADFYTFWLATDGYTTHIRRSMDDEDIYRYTAPQIQTCCARKESRLILGGFDNAFGYVDWTAILAAYNSAETVGAPGINWVWGSSVGAADWMMLFDDELHGDWQFWTYHWRERVEFYTDLWRRNQMFMRPMPWRGYVWNVKPLGDTVMVYGQDGVAALTFHDSGIVGMKPIQRYPERLGLMGRDTVAGNDDVHVMQSSDGDLWQITPDLVAQKLKYNWVLPTEPEGTRSAMSYEPLEQEFYISNAEESVVEEDTLVYTGYVRYVAADSEAETPDGTTWETAYLTIQEAIDDVDTNRGTDYGYVFVKSGTYTDNTVDYQVITAKENIYVMGGYSGIGLAKSGITVVDGESARRCVGALSLDGFIYFSGITFVNGVMRLTSDGGFEVPTQGAFAIEDVNGVYFVNCTIADMGANSTSQNVFYIYNTSSGYASAPVLFLNCTFDTNTISTTTGSPSVICFDSVVAGNCTVDACTFTSMKARSRAIIYANSRSAAVVGLRVYGCTFTLCDVTYDHAALVYGNSDTNVIMRDCYAHENKGHLIRGVYEGEFYIYQSEFAYNTDDAYFMHVGTNAGYDPFTVDGCYIHHNDAGNGNGVFGSWAGWRRITISNTIMTSNTPANIWLDDALNNVGALTIENCNINGSNLVQTASSGTHIGSVSITRSNMGTLKLRPLTVGSTFTLNECYFAQLTCAYDSTGHGTITITDSTGYVIYASGAGDTTPGGIITGWDGWPPTNVSYLFTGHGHVTYVKNVGENNNPWYFSNVYSEIEEPDVGPYPEEDEDTTGSLCVVIEEPVMLGRWSLLDEDDWHYTMEDGDLYVMTGLAPGLYTIEFEDVTGGWNKPMRIRAMVRPGRTTFIYQDYFINKTGEPPETDAKTYMLNQNGLCQHYQSPIGFIGNEFCGIDDDLAIEIVTPVFDMGIRQTSEKASFVDVAVNDPDTMYVQAYERKDTTQAYTARTAVAVDTRGRARVKSTGVDQYMKITANSADNIDTLVVLPIEQKDSGR